MKHFLLSTFLCLLVHVTIKAQMPAPASEVEDRLTDLTGKITDAKDHKALYDVSIQLVGTRFSTSSNVDGEYFIRQIPEGTYKLLITADGFKTYKNNITLKRGKINEINVALTRDGVDLEDVVVTGSRTAQRRKLATSVIGVINSTTLERTQSEDLAQGLKFQPGIRVESNCQNCGFTQVRINGLDGPYSQILIDSRPVFSALAGVYGLEQIPTNMIDHVEMLRGGGSALYGGSAIAGTINIITKMPERNTATASHEIRGLGGFNTFENITNVNASILSHNRKLGLVLFGQDRHRSGYDANGDHYTDLPVLDGRTFGFRSFVRPNNNINLSVEYHVSNEFRRGGDLLQNEPHNAHIAEQIRHTNHLGSFDFNFLSPDRHHNVSLYGSMMKIHRRSYYGGDDVLASDVLQQGTQNLSESREKFIEDLRKKNPNISDDEIQDKVDNIFNKGNNTGLTNADWDILDKRMMSYGAANDLTYMLGAQYTYNFDRLFFLPSHLTVGTEYLHDQLDDISGFRPHPIYQTVDTKSLFAQNEWQSDHFSLLVGARLDKHKLLSKAMISPRVSMRYAPNEAFTFRLGYSKGFRAPQIFDEDLHVDNAGGDLIISTNDPNLKAEVSNSINFSTDWYKCFGDWQMNITAEAFYTVLKDAFAFNESSKINAQGKSYIEKMRVNSDGAKVAGFDFETRIAYKDFLSFQGGVTVHSSRWDKARQWNDDDSYKTRRIYRTPNAYGYFVANIAPTHRLNISVTGNLTGSMLTGHEIPTEDDGTLTPYKDGTAAKIDASRMKYGEGQTATTYGPRTFETPVFFEMGLRGSYDFTILGSSKLQVYVGIQNIFNAYQKDLDRGPSRDSAYTYGPLRPRSYFAGVKLTL